MWKIETVNKVLKMFETRNKIECSVLSLLRAIPILCQASSSIRVGKLKRVVSEEKRPPMYAALEMCVNISTGTP